MATSNDTALAYGQLPDGGNPSMACANPDCEAFTVLYSATRGDYFMMSTDDLVTCSMCGEPMRLARERTGVDFL